MKNIYKILIAVGIVGLAFFFSSRLTHAALTPVSWIRDTVAGFLRPGVTTDTLRIPSLISCNTIDTDADGDFACGTDSGGAPTDADYLVGTANGSLSAEIVVGTAPGGELGGTWASPTLDDSVTVTGWVLGTSSATTLTAGTVNVDLLDGVGAVDMDYGSADITDHTFTTDGTGDAEIVLPVGSISTGEILNATILAEDLKAVDSPADEECLTKEDTTGDFEWQACGSGGVPTAITVADEAADTTSFISFFTDATGDLGPKTNTGLLFNASSGLLTTGRLLVSSSNFTIGASLPFSDSVGTLTLQNIDVLDATTETTLESTLDIAGDVTGTGLSTVVIADNAVDGTDIALGSDAQGDVMYYDGTNWVRLPIGTAGQVLEVNAGATAPEWDTDDGGGGSGDVTSVGDCATADCFTGTSGTLLTFNDAGGDATLEYDNTNNWFEVSSIFNPSANDGATLGNASQSWSDLFLASGAVTNWNNGDMTLTHSSNALRYGGGIVSFSDAAPVAVTGTERVMFEDADGNLSDWSFRVAGGGFGTTNYAGSRGTLATPTVSTENDSVGQVTFLGHDGTNYEEAAYIRGYIGAGTPGNNDMPGTIAFATTSDGGTTPLQRVIINPAGELLANLGSDNVMYDCQELGLDPYSKITTGTRKDSIIMPYAMTVTHVYASLTTGPTGSVATFDINEDTDREGAGATATILSTKLTIDASEYSSQSAATAPVISDTALAKGSEVSFDTDGVGSTTPGNGIHIEFCGPINY